MDERPPEPPLSALIDAGLALAAELDLDVLLQRIADLSRNVIGAKYGAVGVLGSDGSLVKFLHSGMDDETVRRIGDLPEGKGLLGAIVEEGRPLRTPEISEHPRSHGFPANHPEMHSFLGVPIVARGEIFGRLYLTEKRGSATFSKDDERLALALAAQAGVAVQNARLYQQVRDRSEELAHRLAELSSVEVIGRVLLSQSTAEEMFRAVADEARIVTRATRSMLALLDHETGDLIVRMAVGDQIAADLMSARIPAETSKAHAVIRRATGELVEDLSVDPEVEPETWRLLGKPRTGAFAPLVIKGQGVGTLAVFGRAGRKPFSVDDLTILQVFAGMAAIALENERLNEALRDMAVLEDRERISKELHDGVIQSIYSVGLSLQGSVSLLRRDPDKAQSRIDQAISELDNVVRDVRGYIFELQPKIVEESGLAEAIKALVRELEINTLAHAQVELDEEACAALDTDRQIHVVQIVREILSNIARHSQASEIAVSFNVDDQHVVLVIEDNGIGFDISKVKRGQGLDNIRYRAMESRGSLDIEGRAEGGTVHRLKIPFEETGERHD